MLSTYTGYVQYYFNKFDTHKKELSFSIILESGKDMLSVQAAVINAYPDVLALAHYMEFHYEESEWKGMQNPPDQLGELV